MAIAALAVWACTAAAGIYLLTSVIRPKPAEPDPEAEPVALDAPTPPGTPQPITQAKPSAPPGDHPVLEFCHPALGILGLACWFAFVATHDRTFAHAALVVLVLTIVFGLGWVTANGLAARRHADDGLAPAVPVRRIVLHGLAATATCVIAIVAILR